MTETKLERKTLREWRQEMRLTQLEVAELAGISDNHYRQYERGDLSIRKKTGLKITNALGIKPSQVVPAEWKIDVDTSDWVDDGFSPEAPRQTLKWWRERRGLSQRELSYLAGISIGYAGNIEGGAVKRVPPHTRRKLARALQVAPVKLIFPGDDAVPSSEKSLESILRAELRGARRALGKAHDFMVDDANITFRAQDKRDSLLPEIQRELKGT
jgi:transcriptional regulator with XRE-family HTH domain